MLADKTTGESCAIAEVMEEALLSRDIVGVQDFVLLENFTNIQAFIENLRKRFQENLIYVSRLPIDQCLKSWAYMADSGRHGPARWAIGLMATMLLCIGKYLQCNHARYYNTFRKT